MGSEDEVATAFYYDFVYKHAAIMLSLPFILAILVFIKIYVKLFKQYRKRTKVFSAK